MVFNNIFITTSRRILLNKLPRVNTPPFRAQSISIAAFSPPTCHESFQTRRGHSYDVSSLSSQLGSGVKINLVPRRFKKTKSRGSKKQQEEDEEEDDDEDEEENPLLMDDLVEGADGAERVVIEVGSLRLDAVGKTAFSVTRYKMEELFYKGDLFVNGQRASKKGQDLHLGDEVDLIKGVNAEDRNKVDVKRIHIIEMPDKASEQGRMKIKIDRWQYLTIDAPDRSAE